MSKKNLFYLDLDELRRLLDDANTHLVASATKYAERTEQFLAETPAPDDTRLKSAKEQVAIKADELRRNRLDDAKPFKDAVKVIEKFYAPHETSINQAKASIIAEIKRRLATSSHLQNDPAPPQAPVISSSSSTPVVSISQPQNAEVSADWETSLEAVAVDRSALDSQEVIRFLSDYHILTAARKALKEDPGLRIAGISYEEVPK